MSLDWETAAIFLMIGVWTFAVYRFVRWYSSRYCLREVVCRRVDAVALQPPPSPRLPRKALSLIDAA
jgi:hypothetical protein